MEYYLKQLEHTYSEELEQKAKNTYDEINHLKFKMEFERKECNKFDTRVKTFEEFQNMKFVEKLSKKILNKDLGSNN